MDGSGNVGRVLRGSVVWLGVILGVLTLIYFVFATSGRPLDLLKLVVPLFLSLGVITLGVGLVRGESSVSRIVTVSASGIGGMVLLGVASSFTLTVQRLEGGNVESYRYLLLSNASVGAAVGTVLGVYRVRLRQKADQLANEVNRLNEFAGIVAHDLRNPLHIAQGYLGELPREGSEEELATIDRAHARMEQLIDHVLVLSRRGAAAGETTAVELGGVARVAWNETPTDDAELRVASDRSIRADERRLRSLFENLFSNAVRHGGETVTVTVRASERRFYVEDDGRGIPPERRERIFEGGYSSDETGTGLGLAIVRQIANAHDWTVAVGESETGGARFEFRL